MPKKVKYPIDLDDKQTKELLKLALLMELADAEIEKFAGKKKVIRQSIGEIIGKFVHVDDEPVEGSARITVDELKVEVIKSKRRSIDVDDWKEYVRGKLSVDEKGLFKAKLTISLSAWRSLPDEDKAIVARCMTTGDLSTSIKVERKKVKDAE